MTFNFDEIIDRRGTNSMKWSQGAKRLTQEQCNADPLPMWVADMDFRIAPAISQALHEMIDMGVLGYSGTTEACAEAVIDWHARRFGWRPRAEWLTQASGVVHAMSMVIQAFSQPGDHVIVQTPVYAHFLNDAVVNGRRVIQAPLRLEGDRYRFDPEAFEAALLPGLIGWGKTREILITGETFGAEPALTMGFVQKVVPAAELDAAVDHWLGLIGRATPKAVRNQKALMNRWERVSVEEGDVLFRQAHADFHTRDATAPAP